MPDQNLRQRRFILPRRLALTALALLLAAAVWLPLVHFLFRPDLAQYVQPAGIPPRARAIADYHLALWADPALREKEIGRMRLSNAEWDFMGRTFLVLSLANMALREPAMKPQCLGVIDAIIDETLRLEKQNGIFFFLMKYAQDDAFVNKPARSLFEDGEIALMLGARCVLDKKPQYLKFLDERVSIILDCMNKGPVLCAESYPNECWMFCNTAALAAVKMSDAVNHTDHGEFFRRWLATAKTKLVDKHTGILISSFNLTGAVIDGPEGSSIWFVSHCLALLDEDFARDQYTRARKELYRSILGFGYAVEWPASYLGPPDIDSGPIIPVLHASAGSSGQAFMAANEFGDSGHLCELLTSLNLAGFPTERGGRLRYCASNQVGDAVLLYSLVLGPLWKEVKERTAK